MKTYSVILTTLLIELFTQTFSFYAEANEIRRRTKATKVPKGVKGEKGSKSGKNKKGKSSALVGLIGVPDNSEPFGTVTVRYSVDGSFLLAVNLNALEPGSGSVMITEGTSCDGTYNLTPFTSKDTWDGTVNYYNALTEGISKSAFRFNNGKTYQENLGKTVILKDSTSAPVGCAVLKEETMVKTLEAKMGPYPGYTGTLKPSGKVRVMFSHDDTFRFQYDFSGLDANCTNCGVHIHSGLSCASTAEVKGHGFNSVLVQDLWTTDGGAFYNSDANGYASGYFSLFNGFGYEENFHHAVVIHSQTGSRIACGVLM
jgi:hypothetical protein